jgi:hypothetical protein
MKTIRAHNLWKKEKILNEEKEKKIAGGVRPHGKVRTLCSRSDAAPIAPGDWLRDWVFVSNHSKVGYYTVWPPYASILPHSILGLVLLEHQLLPRKLHLEFRRPSCWQQSTQHRASHVVSVAQSLRLATQSTRDRAIEIQTKQTQTST